MKAENIAVLDMRKVVNFCDYFVLCTGNSSRHVRAISDYIDEKLMDIQFAVRSMTSLPAEKFKIKDRGMLAKGYYADVAVLDLDRICDQATYHDPHQYADGIEYLMVNGKLSIEKGKATGKRGGRPIKRA